MEAKYRQLQKYKIANCNNNTTGKITCYEGAKDILDEGREDNRLKDELEPAK